MTRKELIQGGVGAALLSALTRPARAQNPLSQTPLPVVATLATIDVDTLPLNPQTLASLRPLGQGSEKSPETARRALVALGALLYELDTRGKSGGESVASFRARLEKELAVRQIPHGVLWRFETLRRRLSGEASGRKTRRRQARAQAPDQAARELLREGQKLVLRMVDTESEVRKNG